MKAGQTINIPKFSSDPLVTVQPGSLDVDITDKLGKDVTVRGVNPYTFGGPNAFFERFGGAPTVPGDAVGAAGPGGDIAAHLGDLPKTPKTQADRDLFAFGDKTMPTVPFQVSEPVSIAMQQAEENINRRLQKGMIDEDEYDLEMTELRNRPPVVPGRPLDLPSSSGIAAALEGGPTGDTPIDTGQTAPWLTDYQTDPSASKEVHGLARAIENWASVLNLDPVIVNQFEQTLFGNLHDIANPEQDLGTRGMGLAPESGSVQNFLETTVGGVAGMAGGLIEAFGVEGGQERYYEAAITAIRNEYSPSEQLEAQGVIDAVNEEASNKAKYTDGPIIPRTAEQLQSIEAARLTSLFLFGQVLGGKKGYGPGGDAEMPRTISSYVANELPHNPKSAGLKAYFESAFGVEGFETWEDMLTYLKYAPDPFKPWMWVRQDKPQLSAGSAGLYNYSGGSYGYGGGGGRSYPRSGGSSSYTYSPMVMWRIGV